MLAQFLEGITLDPALVLVAPALNVIGYALKQTPFIPNWLIIWILLGLGIIAGILSIGFTVNGVANGIIATGMAITTHQAVKQTIEQK
ncbi:phage holin family protein [Ammoniphilus sp. 3BR4]|uniref:phage holin family protein n=1 Tax=Ammoniphilus sp. 3BR4 TaxID=3158265 RepID=UPI0034656E7A